MPKRNMSFETMRSNLEKHRDKIAKDRDELRDLLEEWTAIVDTCDRAIEYIECAVESLSEYA